MAAEIVIPKQFRLRVRTSRGSGYVEKIRDREDGVETSSFLVRLDRGGNPFWASNTSVQPIGFSPLR